MTTDPPDGQDQRPARSAPLLHPASLGAMALLGLNDHLFKWVFPGLITGKLSDFAGLVFFPLVLEFLLRSRRLSVFVTAVGFVLVKGTAWGCALWNSVATSALRWLALDAAAHLRQDSTDLIALLALFIPLYVIPRRH
jgi:hypothetical protein